MDFAVTLVHPIGKFIYIALQVLNAERVVDTVKTPLEYSPNALDTIGVGNAVHKLLGRMIDGHVLEFVLVA